MTASVQASGFAANIFARRIGGKLIGLIGTNRTGTGAGRKVQSEFVALNDAGDLLERTIVLRR